MKELIIEIIESIAAASCSAAVVAWAGYATTVAVI